MLRSKCDPLVVERSDRFESEDKIIGILKQAGAGVKVAELCRNGIAEATDYNRKAHCQALRA